ncbi:unnamed protein product [Pylaiella littoralis]
MSDLRKLFASSPEKIAKLAALPFEPGTMPSHKTSHTAMPREELVFPDCLTSELSVARVAPLTHSQQVAAFCNQATTTPGQHGVPFIPTPARSTRASSARPALPQAGTRPSAAPSPHPPAAPRTPPPATAPLTDILDYLWEQRVCFTHAFAGCTRPGCRWSHATVAAGYYSASSSRNRQNGSGGAGAGNRRRLAAMTEIKYELAADLGLLYTEEDEAGDASAQETADSHHA